MIKRSFYCVFIMMLYSCNYFNPVTKPHAIARVEDSYLFIEELKDLVPPGTSKQDSTNIVRNYIDRWASQKLLIHAAEINISNKKKESFDHLIKQYKIDLYTKAYIEDVVKSTVDTVISLQEMKQYYNDNKENFKTNGTLLRLRYINLKKDNPKYETIKSKFFDFRNTDKRFWDTYVLQFKNFALNDSVWVEMSQIYSKLPFINPDNKESFISSGKTIQHPEGTDMYLVKINAVIDKNEIAPFDYLKPTLREVLLNRRKLELIKKFEKEITDDAIKDQKYEVYK